VEWSSARIWFSAAGENDNGREWIDLFRRSTGHESKGGKRSKSNPRKEAGVSGHNPIYDHLVGDDEQSIDKLVAYALYKAHKRKWLRQVRSSTGHGPSNEEVAVFVSGCESNLDSYVQRADLALASYAEQIVIAEAPEIARRAVAGEIEAGVDRLESGFSFLKQLGIGVLSWLVSLVILLLVSWAAKTMGIDLLSALKP